MKHVYDIDMMMYVGDWVRDKIEFAQSMLNGMFCIKDHPYLNKRFCHDRLCNKYCL